MLLSKRSLLAAALFSGSALSLAHTAYGQDEQNEHRRATWNQQQNQDNDGDKDKNHNNNGRWGNGQRGNSDNAGNGRRDRDGDHQYTQQGNNQGAWNQRRDHDGDERNDRRNGQYGQQGQYGQYGQQGQYGQYGQQGQYGNYPYGQNGNYGYGRNGNSGYGQVDQGQANSNQVAYQNGVQAGQYDAQRDLRANRRNVDYTQSDRYGNAPGWNAQMGDRNQYKQYFRQGYAAAYQQTIAQGYNNNNGGYYGVRR